MKYFLIGLFCSSAILFGYTLSVNKQKDLDLTYRGPQIGHCYKLNVNAIMVIGIVGEQYFYKNSWNNQDKIFSEPSYVFFGYEIPCGKDGYEFEVLAIRLLKAEQDIALLSKEVKK